jgi:hypothetical protein
MTFVTKLYGVILTVLDSTSGAGPSVAIDPV